MNQISIALAGFSIVVLFLLLFPDYFSMIYSALFFLGAGHMIHLALRWNLSLALVLAWSIAVAISGILTSQLIESLLFAQIMIIYSIIYAINNGVDQLF